MGSVLCLDCRCSKRPVTGGFDQSCRLWKVSDESQLVFKTHSLATDSCGIITDSQWLTGDQNGCVCLWTTAKKKPLSIASLVKNSTKQIGAGSNNKLPIRSYCRGPWRWCYQVVEI